MTRNIGVYGTLRKNGYDELVHDEYKKYINELNSIIETQGKVF